MGALLGPCRLAWRRRWRRGRSLGARPRGLVLFIAKVEGIPALAGAIGTPIDAVSHSTTPDLKPAAGHMAAMRYPYSVENYDAIARLLEVGVFKLQNPRTGTWIETTVGHTATEVEKRIGRRVLRKISDERVEGEDDDEIQVIELSLTREQIAEEVPFAQAESREFAKKLD